MNGGDDRLMELEIRLTHLARDQEQLSEVVIEQGRQIDKLSKSVELLRGKFREVLDALESGEETDVE